MTDLVVVKKLADAWRQAIDRCDFSEDPVMRTFPRGSCGDATLLVAKFLNRHGIEQVEYVVGQSAPEHTACGSHAWAETRGVIVDVSADQFECNPAPPVIVTRDRSWHSHFVELDRHPAQIEAYDDFTKYRLLDLYDRILARVEGASRGGAG